MLAGMLAVTACAVGPTHVRPDLPVASKWQAPLPHGGNSAQLADWWQQFNDPVLAELQRAAQAGNPTLDKAAAAIRGARASVTSARASYWPSVSAGGTASRSSDGFSVTEATASGLDASWEIDLLGGTRRSSESARAALEARQADWHDARVSLAAEVATDYVDYRACRQKEGAYREQAQSYQETVRSTKVSVSAGFSAPSDLALAEAGAASASSTAKAQAVQCELGVKALVAVTGLVEPRLRQLLGTDVAPLPTPSQATVESVPASLVTQRPDVVSAERQLAAANAEIGVAEAARWPKLTITGDITASRVAGVSTTPWSIASSLTAPLFNAGALSANVEKARASYDSALADYRAAVRTAVLEVEQALVNLEGAAQRESDARTSATQYQTYFRAADTNWQAGRTELLDLEIARRASISAQVSLIELMQTRVDQWIALYKALGGSWSGPPASGSGEES